MMTPSLPRRCGSRGHSRPDRPGPTRRPRPFCAAGPTAESRRPIWSRPRPPARCSTPRTCAGPSTVSPTRAPDTPCSPAAEEQLVRIGIAIGEDLPALRDELLDGVGLIGPEGLIKERLVALAEAGVTTLNMTPLGVNETGQTGQTGQIPWRYGYERQGACRGCTPAPAPGGGPTVLR